MAREQGRERLDVERTAVGVVGIDNDRERVPAGIASVARSKSKPRSGRRGVSVKRFAISGKSA